MSRGPWPSEQTKIAIFSDYTLNPSPAVVAKKYGLNPATISRIVKKMREAPIQPAIFQDSKTWKEKAVNLCQDRFLDAVRCDDDVYKAGTLAATGLKGLGVFQPDNVTQINNLYASMPEDWRAEYDTTIVTPTKTDDPTDK